MRLIGVPIGAFGNAGHIWQSGRWWTRWAVQITLDIRGTAISLPGNL